MTDDTMNDDTMNRAMRRALAGRFTETPAGARDALSGQFAAPNDLIRRATGRPTAGDVAATEQLAAAARGREEEWQAAEAARTAPIRAAAKRRGFRDVTDPELMLPAGLDTSDPEAVAAAVNQLATEKPHLVDRASAPSAPSWDGGARITVPPPIDMNEELRERLWNIRMERGRGRFTETDKLSLRDVAASD